MNWPARITWPNDHPVFEDAALAPFADGISEIAPDAIAFRLLRYLPGRRVATQVSTGDALAVIKVFASPRGRGNDRRLSALQECLPDLVPRALGSDHGGHVSMVSWQEGDVYDQLGAAEFVSSSRAIGEALRTLHSSPITLDRCWGLDKELDQLVRRTPDHLMGLAQESPNAARTRLRRMRSSSPIATVILARSS